MDQQLDGIDTCRKSYKWYKKLFLRQVMQCVCGPKLGCTSAICMVTLLEPLGPDLIPRGCQLFVREEPPSSTQA